MIDLTRSQPVRLCIGGLGDVNARVEEAADGRLALALSVDLDVPLESLAHRSAQVEFSTERGLYRVSGDVLSRDGRGLVELSVDGTERIQRRTDVRVAAVRPVSIVQRADDDERTASTVDLSGSGLLIAQMDGLGLGERIAFALDLDGPSVGGEGEVVREDGRGRKGVRIDRISSHDRELLIRFVFTRQRLHRQRGLA